MGIFDFLTGQSSYQPVSPSQQGWEAFTQAQLGAPSPYKIPQWQTIAKGLLAGNQAYRQAQNQQILKQAISSPDASSVFGALANSDDPQIQNAILKYKLDQASPDNQLKSTLLKQMSGGSAQNQGGADITSSPLFAMAFPEQARAINQIKTSDPEYIKRAEAAKKEAQTGGEALSKMQEANNKLPNLTQDLNALESKIRKVDPSLLGPIRGSISYYTNPQIQSLTSDARSVALQLKDIYNLGSGQGFTDADRNYLDSIIGGAKVDPVAALDIMKGMHLKISTMKNNYNQASDYYKQNGSLTGFSPSAPPSPDGRARPPLSSFMR